MGARYAASLAVLLSLFSVRPALADRERLSRPLASPPDFIEEESPPAPTLGPVDTNTLVAPDQPKAAPAPSAAPTSRPRLWEVDLAPEFATGCCSLGVDLSVSRTLKLNEAMKLEFQVNVGQGDFLAAGTPYSAGGEIRFSSVVIKDRLSLGVNAGGTGDLVAKGSWSVPLKVRATIGGLHQIKEWALALRLSAGATPGSTGTGFSGGAVLGYARDVTNAGFADFSVRLNGSYALSGTTSEKAGLDTTFQITSALSLELTPLVVLSQTPGKLENGVQIAATNSVSFDATLTFIAMF